MKKIEKALLVQDDQIKRISKTLSDVQAVGSELKEGNAAQKTKLDEADEQMNQLFASLGINRLDLDLEGVETSNSIQLSSNEMANIKPPSFERLPIVVGTNWDEYEENIDSYMAKYELDLTIDPIKQLLSAQQYREIENKFHQEFGDTRWTKWDYTIVGLAALVGFLVDLLVVKMPARAADKYVPQSQKSPAGKWVNKMMDSYLNPENNATIRNLESWAKTPYDAVNVKSFDRIISEEGPIKMNANLHRLKTPGHDPVLQLIFGVLDCMNGTISVFDQSGKLAVLDNPNFVGTNLFLSITKTLAHFITDIGTPKGVVPPFFSLTQAITLDTPFEINDRGTMRNMKLNELAERMYSVGGYNFNHFLVMSLVPLSVEMIVRSYRWMTKPETNVDFKRDYKLNSMLTVAHSLTMSTNIMKMWLNGWNPLAFNYAELLMLIKSFYSFVKAKTERDKKIESTLLHNWEEIYRAQL
ncbi:hypothetical protein ACFFF5_13030 [Lederbergia wuyishanensis]|uniref:Uncharacterized protein n=1 Tax=Lederbergia wuyishanensis TaxID=1347903 RepID=A0ABU0D816_9BACI|nr:hypothetical protein [Lederbergia wuyishanensis]MCJ8009333.1 hypothetical protein [Lederbergia wuyishanensis]MDQ0344532.1 hypothetical protein [Lederbergia wuyishanensis]